MIEQYVLQSAAIATVAMTVGKTHAFKWLREWLMEKVGHDRKIRTWKWWIWVSNLVKCPYCLSHWLSLFVTLVTRPEGGVVFWALYAFALVAGASVFGLLICCYLRMLESLE